MAFEITVVFLLVCIVIFLCALISLVRRIACSIAALINAFAALISIESYKVGEVDKASLRVVTSTQTKEQNHERP